MLRFEYIKRYMRSSIDAFSTMKFFIGTRLQVANIRCRFRLFARRYRASKNHQTNGEKDCPRSSHPDTLFSSHILPFPDLSASGAPQITRDGRYTGKYVSTSCAPAYSPPPRYATRILAILPVYCRFFDSDEPNGVRSTEGASVVLSR